MRTWNGLSSTEKERAVDKALLELLECIVEGGIRFDDEKNNDTLQADIDKAMIEADEMQTPWFSHEYVMESVGSILRDMARQDAQEAYYPGCDERIIRIT